MCCYNLSNEVVGTSYYGTFAHGLLIALPPFTLQRRRLCVTLWKLHNTLRIFVRRTHNPLWNKEVSANMLKFLHLQFKIVPLILTWAPFYDNAFIYIYFWVGSFSPFFFSRPLAIGCTIETGGTNTTKVFFFLRIHPSKLWLNGANQNMVMIFTFEFGYVSSLHFASSLLALWFIFLW